MESICLKVGQLIQDYAVQMEVFGLRALSPLMERLQARGVVQLVWDDPEARIYERRGHLQSLIKPFETKGLLTPRPLRVVVRNGGYPGYVRTRSGWRAVETLLESWELTEEWWSEYPVFRTYYRVYLTGGVYKRLFFDHVVRQWFCH